MSTDPQISFGDQVRVRATDETERRGLAGLVGQVHGETTPSVTGVEVIGPDTGDFAFGVHFESRGEVLWFVPTLLELIDHAPGTEMRFKGVPKKWVRDASGEWLEIPDKPWWKFW